jgi:ABC-type glycerol-3-phosphate transport system substrate-binding protein
MPVRRFPMARFFRRRRRWSAPLLLALVTALLGGCRWLPQPPVNLQVTISVAGNDRVSQLSLRRLASQMADDYMRANPGVNLHLRFLPEAELLPALRARSSLGAGPDLVIAGGSSTYELFREGLIRPPSIPQSRLYPLHLRFLPSFRQPEGFAAIPFLVQPPLACYDRRRVQQAPTRIDDLPRLAAAGRRLGLSLTPTELLWTTSGFGAQQPLLRLMSPTPERVELSAEERQAMTRWLEWLYRANVQPNLQFMESSTQLVERLEAGSLDWISCPGTAISRLRKTLGSNLQISILPAGMDGKPSQPLARLLLLGFGRDSNAAERRFAEKFALFVLNDYSQNNLMVRALGSMPVNGNVIVPVKEVPDLAPLEASLSHSVVLDFRGGIGLARQAEPLRQLLKETVYGDTAPAAVIEGIQALGQSTRSSRP